MFYVSKEVLEEKMQQCLKILLHKIKETVSMMHRVDIEEDCQKITLSIVCIA